MLLSPTLEKLRQIKLTAGLEGRLGQLVNKDKELREKRKLTRRLDRTLKSAVAGATGIP